MLAKEIIETLPIGIFATDATGDIIEANSALSNIFGSPSAKEIKKINVFDHQPFKATGVAEELKKVLNGEKISLKMEYYSIWDKKAEIHLTAIPLKDEKGVTGILGVVEDLTQEIKLEKELEKKETELKKLRDEVSDVDRIKDDILTNVAHELYTPLTIAQNAMEMAVDEKDERERAKFLTTGKNSLMRLDNVIKALIYASKSEDLNFNKKEIDLKESIKNAVGKIASEASKKNVEIMLSLPDSLPLVKIDESAMNHVLYNLLSNAIKFNKEGGKIFVEAKKKKGFVEVSIADTGIGIPKETMQKIFAPLFQADATTTREYAGTGLGLFNAKKILEAHGGKIWAVSELNEGSTFHFTLPFK